MMSRPPGPTKHDPSSRLLPSRTTGSLGSRDAGDPDALALMGDTPGSTGSNDGAAAAFSGWQEGPSVQHTLAYARHQVGASTAGNSVSPAKVYEITYKGTAVRLTEEEYKNAVRRVARNLEIDFKGIEEWAAYCAQVHQDFLDNTHNFFGVVSDILGDTAPPHIGIWSWPKAPISNGRQALQDGRLESASKQLQLAEDALRDAQREWNAYIDKTTGGAEKATAYLRNTRDISFGIAIGTTAIVAAPVVAVGVSGLADGVGLTGLTATGVTAIGTGVTVTAGGAAAGATLRAGSAALGQGLAFGKVDPDDIKKEAREGAKRGLVDAATSVATLGAARAVGPGASLAGRVVRGGAASGVGGATGGALQAGLEGGSARQMGKTAATSGLTGVVGGGVGAALGGSAATQSVGRRLLAGTGGGGAAGFVGAAMTGQDKTQGTVTGVLTGLATSVPNHYNSTPADLGQAEFESFLEFLREEGATGPLRAGELLKLGPHAAAAHNRAELGVSGKQVQSAHNAPQSVMRNVPGGYNENHALTLLMERHSHSGMDLYWKETFQNMRRAGATSATAQTIHDVVAESVRRTPSMRAGEKFSIISRLSDEMFVEFGLKPGHILPLPYPNVKP